MTKLEFKNYLFQRQQDISEEGKNVKDFMAAMAYIIAINLLEEIIRKFDTVKD